MGTVPRSLRLLTNIVLIVSPGATFCQTNPSASIVNQVEEKVAKYLTSLADLHCMESVTQEKLGPSGHVEAREHAQYDYLIMMQGGNDDFQLNETRVATSLDKSKPIPASMLVSNGIATALLVFHPYYRDSFNFEIRDEELVDGRPATPVHFTHIPGRRTPAALALRGREYPLELEGTAWLDKQSGAVVKVDAGLMRDMSDVGLRSMSIHVEYKPEPLGEKSRNIILPVLAVVDVTTPRQHWRNTHVFDDYRSFSTNAEQDPNVKIASRNPAAGDDNSAAGTTTKAKEKP